MIYRITFGFAGAQTGWAETHAMLSNLNNPKDLMPTLSDIAQKRAQMLGREFAIVAIRAARYATDGGVRSKGSFILKQRFVNNISSAAAAAEPGDVALVVRGSAEPSILNPQFDANSNQTWLGGPCDDAVNNAGVVDPGKAGLGSAFASWRSAMLGTTVGWLASSVLLDTPLGNIVQQENGTVRMQTSATTAGILTIGQRYKARIRSVNNGASPLNGEIVVFCSALNTLDTTEVIGIPTDQNGGAIKVYKQVQPFVDYGDLTLNLQVGNHKRGRPFGSTPGRARRRVKG
jgi:hypothetical protein